MTHEKNESGEVLGKYPAVLGGTRIAKEQFVLVV